jgi:hypothetical protein
MSEVQSVPIPTSDQLNPPSVFEFAVRRRGWMLVAFFLTITAVYLSFPTKNYYWDGVSFAQTIEHSRTMSASLIHPNHLIYNVFGWAVYQAVLRVGFATRALYVLQRANAVLAGLCVTLVFTLLHRATNSARAAAVLAVLFAFSGTWWKFAADADAYIPSVLLLVAACCLVLPGRNPRPATVALTHSCAIFFHQLAVLFFPVALLGIWLQTESLPKTRRIVEMVRYAVPVTLFSLAGYAFGFVVSRHSLAPGVLARWLTSHSEGSSFSFALRRNAIVTVKNYAQLFFAGRPALVRFSDPWTIVSATALVLVTVMLLASLARNGIQLRLVLRNRPVFMLACAWVGVYSGFLIFWEPYNAFYKLFLLPGIVLVVASFSGEPTRVQHSQAWLLVAVVALSNFTFAILPYSRVSSNALGQFAVGLHDVWARNAVIYYAEYSGNDWFPQYFNPETSWRQLNRQDLAQAKADIERTQRSGREVWLDSTAIDLLAKEDGGWLREHTVAGKRAELDDSKHDLRFIRLTM